ncbi:hypothetical protein CL619_04845 [archaeon]|nr:hypothetical protein [archaeon]|tara:strand:- start:3824 stop:4447 length:624 start_codon:yes stop_codon:yes gene_type:complete
MQEYPGFVFGENTKSLLEMHLALYQIHEDELQIERPYLITAIEATLPRVYLELGLAAGSTAKAQLGLQREQHLPPYVPGTAVILALKTDTKRLTSLELEFIGYQELIRWKEWRVQSLAEGEYAKEKFDPYDSSKFSDIDPGKNIAVLHANQQYREGEGILQISDRGLEVTIHEVEIQAPSKTHLYQHVVEFPKGLDPETVALLQKAS